MRAGTMGIASLSGLLCALLASWAGACGGKTESASSGPDGGNGGGSTGSSGSSSSSSTSSSGSPRCEGCLCTPGGTCCGTPCAPYGGSGGSSGSGVNSANDGGAPAECVLQGGVYRCAGVDAAIPACPASVQTQQPCDYTVPPCMGCEDNASPGSLGAGYTCQCEDAGLVPDQDGSLWECIGTEHTCR
jgi:hypothetical protein